jgi:hypothetical protein
MKRIFLLFIIVTGITVAVVAFVANRQTDRALEIVPNPVAAKSSITPPPVLPSKTTIAEASSSIQQVDVASTSKTKKPKKQNLNAGGQPLTINGYVVQDPEARKALSFVGNDPDATAYWASAINDPNLPSEERKDLIEDLNEDGLSDPKHPGPQDLPLIMNRLQLIEELSPNSMDPVDAQAFAEAYKDLSGMLNGQLPQ